MAFEDYKDLDVSREEATIEEIKELAEKNGVSDFFMEKTILQPWKDDSIKVEVESTRVLTEKEKEELIFWLVHLRGGISNLVLPSFSNVKGQLEDKALIDTVKNLKYHY